MTPIDEVKVEALKRQFPHVDDIKDWRAQQTIRLLWDRIFDLEGRLQAAEGTVGSLVEASNTQETILADVARKADAALASATLTRTEVADVEGSKDDHGLGAAGCAASGATGDIGTVTELTLENVGKIICGTGHEYPTLLAATATRAIREANRDELMDRIVWHLGQAGYAAARYGTTEGRPWHVLFDALSPEGESPVRQQSYRCTTYDPPDDGSPWDTTHTIETCCVYGGQSPGVTTTPEAGISD